MKGLETPLDKILVTKYPMINLLMVNWSILPKENLRFAKILCSKNTLNRNWRKPDKNWEVFVNSLTPILFKLNPVVVSANKNNKRNPNLLINIRSLTNLTKRNTTKILLHQKRLLNLIKVLATKLRRRLTLKISLRKVIFQDFVD